MYNGITALTTKRHNIITKQHGGKQQWSLAGTTLNSFDDSNGKSDDDVNVDVDLLTLHLRLAELKVVTRCAFPTTWLRVGDMLILNCGEVLMSICYCCFV